MPTSPTPNPAPSFQRESQTGFRQLKSATLLGAIGQTMIWGGAIALWLVGSLFSDIPVNTSIAYGTKGFNVTAGEIFALNYLLIVGIVAGLVSYILLIRGLRTVGRAFPRLELAPVLVLTTVGAVGLGMFAMGWVVWLGSFVPPSARSASNAFAYSSVMAPAISGAVDFLLAFGGLLAFLGAIGIAVGDSKIGVTFEEVTLEIGGVLSAIPVLAIVGQFIALIGIIGGERKLVMGWTPPPPPPPPPTLIQPVWVYPPGYPQAPSFVPAGPQATWDSLAVVIVVVVILIWVLILPFTLFLATGGLTKGPGGSGSGGVGGGTSPASSTSFSPLPIILVGFVATAIFLPLAMARNRRKRRRASQLPIPPPPPPPPPGPPPAMDEDPLDHLV